MTVYARILLGLGQKEQARQFLNTLSGGQQSSRRKGHSAGPATAGTLLPIYAAWLKALDGQADAAIKTLEKMLQQAGGAPNEVTAEAADVLAMLYMARGEQEKAKKAVDFGLKTLKYQGVNSGYVLALLRGRLNSDIAAGEAKRLYNEAEKRRAEKKFVEAGQLFAQVRAMYPKNQWGHASGFRIGQCYVGLNRLAQAADWWQKFIKESPAGPWRGQAHVAMVDLLLESQLDLAKATEHAIVATTALAKGLDQQAEPSWRDAAYDIHLRQGIVSLVDGRFDAAAQGFQQARQLASSGMSQEVQAGLNRLIEAAEKRVKLVPDELTVGDDRATLALVIGNIYNVLHQYDLAKGYFTLPLNGSMRSRSAGHRSFAGLGLARAVLASGQPISSSKSPASSPRPLGDDHASHGALGVKAALLQARTIFDASLKEYPKGSWHDETLRELALLIERAAAEQFGPPAADSSAEKKNVVQKPAAPPMTDAARQQQKKARAAALPYWAGLPARYPASRYVPQALYHAGILYTETKKPDDALAAFEELATKYADSPWAGDAHVWLIDVKLEQQFDLPGAREHADAAVDWYEHLDQAKAAQARSAPLSLGVGADEQSDALRSLKQIGYDIYVRAGLVEFLLEHPERAVGFFQKAKPLQPERKFVVVHGTIPTGIERLIEAAKSGKSLTPDIVCKGDQKAKLILMLADVYYQGQEWQRSVDLCTRLIKGAAPKASREQKSYAYFKRGRSYYCLRGKARDPDAALADYVAAVRVAPKAPWASNAMFLAANIQWNHKHNADAAASVWNRLIHDYPNSEDVDVSTMFISMVYRCTNRPDEARKVLTDFLAKHSDSPMAESAREELDELVPPPQGRNAPSPRNSGGVKTGRQQ